ncbi:MAG: outer membrane beta-barrel protein [Chitinophagales bacterium]|nr:outer membrane beta-barrel protein [Chitinophagales bacterium]
MSSIWKILITVLCIMSVNVANAQNSDFFSPEKEQVFFGGLTVGANFSTVDGDSYGGYKKVGFVGGGVVYARVLPKLLTSVELLYTQKGSRGVVQKTSLYTGDFFERYWLDVNYVEVPVLIHYVFTPRLHVGVGASYSQLLNYREEVYTDQPLIIDADVTGFKKDDINFVIQGGWQIGTGWFLMARYQRSTNSIREPANIPLWQNSIAQFNDLFSLRLTYLIK